MTRIVLLLMLVAITCAQEHRIKIRKGAITEKIGKVKLIINLVIVKKNMITLNYCREKAIEIENAITDIVNEHPNSQTIQALRELQVSLRDFTGTKKSKRSLLPFVGNILNSLFEVATEASEEKERERLDKIERWASEYGNVINQMVDETNLHANVLNNLSQTLDLVEVNLEKGLDKLATELFLNELTLKAMTILEHLKARMEGLRLAHQGTVSINP